jgi:polysaccharide export outer membrane protein
MKKVSVIVIALIVLITSGQAFCEEKKPKGGWGAETMVDSYQIGIGDILEITTWKEPDFTRPNVLVRSDGKISFPLVNDFPAAGLSPMELKYNLENALKAYVSHPVVTVHVINPMSQKFYILGEVLRTGEYPLVKHLTVLQAFALAGGFTEWASKKEIILLRHEGGKDKIYRVNYKEITKGQDFSQNFKLKADDTIIVP